MKKIIEQLLGGKFEYEQPQLLFSPERISVKLPAGETRRGELYFGTEDNQKIRGFITSSNRRIVPGITKFSGTTICLQYGIDANGMEPGEVCQGWLTITSNIGEYKIPFRIETEKAQVKSSAGEIHDLDSFCAIAKKDVREAYRIFTDKSFPVVMKDSSSYEKALYKGFSNQPVTYQHMEEFLISMKKKEQVTVTLKQEERTFYDVKESMQETMEIQKSGWGHLRLDVETKGDFLELNKHVITDEDFIGSSYHIRYVIREDKLGAGNQHGEIILRSPYQTLTYKILATRSPKIQVNVNLGEKRMRLALLQDYLECRKGNMDFKTWAGSSHYILNQLRESACDYPEYQIYEAYLLHQEGNDEDAVKILKRFQDTTAIREDLELAGAYLFVCSLTGLYTDRELVTRRIQSFYRQKEDSFLLFWICMRMDKSFRETPSMAVFRMEEQFEKGSRSPILYLEAWNYLAKDISLLHRLSKFWIQVLLFAAKGELLNEELVMRMAYLSGYEKSFNNSLYRALSAGYEAFPSDDTLEAICKYIMKGNPRKKEYFKWFALAVERGLRLTRIYEYYVETLDVSYQRDLPKALLMYFTYNSSSLGDAKKAFIYANVVANKDYEPQTYEEYKQSMQAFAKEKLLQGRMNENYAVLYQEFIAKPETSDMAQAVAGKMFTYRLYCDDPKIRQVIVRHSQMEKEEIYPCVQGVAYPRIFHEDAVVMFQDDKQRRYVSTVAYNLTKLMDEQMMLESVLGAGAVDSGLLLNYCENAAITSKNLGVFQLLVQLDTFTDVYKKEIRGKILDYYTKNIHDDEVDRHLKKMDCREYAAVNKKVLIEILISRGLYRQAMGIVEDVGCEGVDLVNLLKMTSRMLVRCDLEEDDELLALASEIYRNGKYDEVLLQYLMLYRYGPIDELFSIWKSAKGFDMDTYDLEERILNLLMFSDDYRKEGEEILQSYVHQSGKERIIGAYLTQIAYGYLVKGYPISEYVRERLEYCYKQKWPVNVICRIALLKLLSREKDEKNIYLKMKEELLEECNNLGYQFAFFHKLPAELLSLYQLDDKMFVECIADPDAKVTLHYALDTGLGVAPEKKTEPMRCHYQGIYTKPFTLFYGETLYYHFTIEKGGKVKETPEREMQMSKVDGLPSSKYQLINQILSARRLEKDQEVQKSMKHFLRQEQYVKEMFGIEKETENE